MFISLVFQISQHSRDEELMKSLVEYLGCGNYYPRSKEWEKKGEFIVVRFHNIYSKIIPFFDKYPIRGIKALDFADFKKVAEILAVKGHLTPRGLEEILKIKGAMNTGRIGALKPSPILGAPSISSTSLLYNKQYFLKRVLSSFSTLTPAIFVYELDTFRVVAIVDGYAEKYIISLSQLTREELETIKAKVDRKSTVKRMVHVYNKDKSVLLKTFSSVNEFMKFSKQSGAVVKQLCLSDVLLWLDEYFISYHLISSADNSLVNISEFKPKLRGRKTSIPVYTYSADGTTFIKRYSSLRDCVKHLEGNRNANTNTLILRIEHKELFHGLRVSFSPLFDHSES
jgi:hypothetical protein